MAQTESAAGDGSTLRGSIDDFAGLYMTGWAYIRPHHACQIKVFDASGAVVARGEAALPRADLIALGLGPCAFRIALPDRPEPETFTVTADGQPFGVPVRVGRGLFDGRLTLSNGELAGWVAERSLPHEPPDIEVVDANGVPLLVVRSFASSAQDDPLCRAWQFFAPIPAVCIGHPDTQLQLRVNGKKIGTPLAVTIFVDGRLDRLEPTRCTGWLGSHQAPARRFEIEVYRDGKPVGRGTAHQSHPLARGPNTGSWEVGFDIHLDPPAQGMGVNYAMSLRLAGTETELFNGPFIVGDRASLIAAARSIANRARTGASGLDAAEGAIVQSAVARYIEDVRRGDIFSSLRPLQSHRENATARRLCVLIPVYRGVEVTRTCIDSVLEQRDASRDTIVLVNDCSPDPGMAALLRAYAWAPNVVLLENETNLGFIQSVNRGLLSCPEGDVLLLNSDTRLFTGALDELVAVANSASDIGTVTALSNNATIFSYPAMNSAEEALDDISWEELALIALVNNRGRSIEVPTAHGFCMLITRSMLDRVGLFDEGFGRGYGEENDFCQRGADLGFRHVAAAGVFVEHRERASFGAEKEALLQVNLPRLAQMYPEYDLSVAKFEVSDPLHFARWPLHRHRLERARADAARVILTVSHQLGGGTTRAEKEIDTTAGFGSAMRLRLSSNSKGAIELQCSSPKLVARFDREEAAAMFEFLEGFGVDTLLVHHTLGFEPELIERLGAFAKGRRAIWYVHDFYPICPRATMIDALGEFCGGPEDARCTRCIDLGGAHEASRTNDLAPPEHRRLFDQVLRQMTQVVAPSSDAAMHLSASIPGLPLTSIRHPQLGITYPGALRDGSWSDIVLLGAIGPHKGSAELLQVARRALLTHPALRFHVIGYTDIDAELRALTNVTITGAYGATDLTRLVKATNARIALFLHKWPETFSYTLSEAVAQGLVPVVPDIGAPAERVRESGFGVIFPHPVNAAIVLDTLEGVGKGRVPFSERGATPAAFDNPDPTPRIEALFAVRGAAPIAPEPIAPIPLAGEPKRTTKPRGERGRR